MNFLILLAILGLGTATNPASLDKTSTLIELAQDPIHLYDINEDGTREEIELYIAKRDEIPSIEPSPTASSSTEAAPSSSTSSLTEADPSLTTATEAPTSSQPEVTSVSPQDSSPSASTDNPQEIPTSKTRPLTQEPQTESSTSSEFESSTSTPSHCGEPINFYIDYRAHDDSFIHDLELILACPGRLSQNQLHDLVAKIQGGASDESHPIPESDRETHEPSTTEANKPEITTKPSTLKELEFLDQDPANQILLYDINEDGTRQDIEIYVAKEAEVPGIEPTPSSSTEAGPAASEDSYPSVSTHFPEEITSSESPLAEPEGPFSDPDLENSNTSEFESPTLSDCNYDADFNVKYREHNNSLIDVVLTLLCADRYTENVAADLITKIGARTSDGSHPIPKWDPINDPYGIEPVLSRTLTQEFTSGSEPESSSLSEFESSTLSDCGEPISFNVDYRGDDNSATQNIALRLECRGRLNLNQIYDLIAKAQAGASDESLPVQKWDDPNLDPDWDNPDVEESTKTPELESSTPTEFNSTIPSDCGDPFGFHVDYRADENRLIQDLALQLKCPRRLNPNQLHDLVAKMRASANNETHPFPESEDSTTEPVDESIVTTEKDGNDFFEILLDPEETTGQYAGDDEAEIFEAELTRFLEDSHNHVLKPDSVTPENTPNELPIGKIQENGTELPPEEDLVLLGGDPDFQLVHEPEPDSPNSDLEYDTDAGDALHAEEELFSEETAGAVLKENSDAQISDLGPVDDAAISNPQDQISPDTPINPDQPSDIAAYDDQVPWEESESVKDRSVIMSEDELSTFLESNPGFAMY